MWNLLSIYSVPGMCDNGCHSRGANAENKNSGQPDGKDKDANQHHRLTKSTGRERRTLQNRSGKHQGSFIKSTSYNLEKGQ